MSAKTSLRQQARCRTKQRAGAWWPTSASSDAGVVELSTRGLPAVLPPHLLAAVPAGERIALAAADPGAPHRCRDPGNAVPAAGLGRPGHPGRSRRRLALRIRRISLDALCSDQLGGDLF